MSHNYEQIARAVVERLTKAGFTAYYAGGWVRDHLLGLPSDDIDIATSATPEEVMALFEKTVPVGLAFGSVIVVEQGYSFEVTTFRTDLQYINGRRPEAIAYSSPEEDAKRRSITINGLFYDPLNETVIDFVSGREDLKKGIIRAIGEPDARFKEDRLRMVRALRFAARFGFVIEETTAQAIKQNAHTLFPAVAIERIWQEFCKASKAPHFDHFLRDLLRYKLLEQIFPDLPKDVEERIHPYPKHWPPILALIELFCDRSLKQRLAIGERLKVSNVDLCMIEQLTFCEHLLENKTAEAADWCHYYALPNARLCLEVLSYRLPPKERNAFATQHEKEMQRLAPHIQRLQTKRPLVTASHLEAQGIAPGPKMGALLRQAERIAINEDLHDPHAVLKKII